MSFTRNAEDQELLIACVRTALERMDQGEPVDPAELCAAHPHLAAPLAEVLGLTAELPALQRAARREDPLAGLVLAGRYELGGCLGRGAMGVVYRADDRELRRSVAVKILDARLFRDAQAEQRFQREAEALAALQHANVVAVFDRGRTPEGIHFLVMELLDGATLAALLVRIADGAEPIAAATELFGAPPESHWPRLCARWARDLAGGLAAAHARGLVHRDVKPSNVFVARPGRPVLLDFGIAARRSDERLTATETTLGTPWYMPPEQVTADASAPVRPAFDVYGLGATLYHLLAGRPPYEGDAPAVIAALAARDPTPLASVRPGLPRDLVAIVEKCLEREVSRRYPDAAALAADLGAFLEHAPITARPLHPLQRRLRQWRRHPARPIAVAAFALVAATAAVAGPIWLRQQRAELRRQQIELQRRLPALLAIDCWPNERVLTELRGEHEQAIAQLDRLIALDPQDLPARLMRAGLLLDVDRRDAAAADVRAVADQQSSPYFRELARRYAASDPQQQGTLAIDFGGLPTPHTPQECWVAGFHELRNRHVDGYAERANELLGRAAADYLPARDLRMLALASLAERTRDRGAKQGLLRELYDEAVALAAIYGAPTARTEAMRGVALVMMGRFAESVAPLEHSLELRPDRHGPHQNLGIALRRLNRLDEAERHLQAALRLHPFAWNTRHTLAQVLSDRGQFAAAYRLADELAASEHARQRVWQKQLVGSIALAEAMSLLELDQAAARAAAQRSVQSYREAQALDASLAESRDQAIAEALTRGDRGQALLAYCRSVIDDPDNPYRLANLAFLLSAGAMGDSGGEQAAWLAAILRRIAARRAGTDDALRARLEQEIEQGLRGRR